MKQFLAVYMGSASGENMKKWNALDEKTRSERTKAGMEAWMAWGEKNKSSIVFQGGPLGKTKLVNLKGIADIKNLMTGFNVVQAESHEAAAKMFLEHPHFTIFQAIASKSWNACPFQAPNEIIINVQQNGCI